MSGETKTAAGKPGRDAEGRPGLFARIAIFVRQVIAELRKVVTPTRSELVNFTIVVLVFVTICMAFVFGLDLAFGNLVRWMFSGV